MHRRNFIKHASSVAFLSATGLNFACSKSKYSPEPSTNGDFEQLVNKLLVDTKTPGLSLAIIKDGEVTFNKGFGVRNTSTNDPVDTETTFEAASVSKTVFAYAIMQLCQKKVMDLDTPLSQYYPELFDNTDPRFEIITARHVLSHTTGLPDWRHSDEPFAFGFDPGKDYRYSGEGFYLLQTVLTHLKGKVYPDQCGTYEMDMKICATDIADYLSENILTPFEMASSHYIWSEERSKNSASAHSEDMSVINKGHQGATDMARYAAAGGLLTHAKDYSKFLISLFDGKDHDPFRLNSSSISTMLTPQIKMKPEQQFDGCTAWALGWGIQERPDGNFIIHSGGQTGFRSLVVACIEKRSGFAAFTNGENGAKVAHELANVVMLGESERE
jgi:CubicO group peptidase (beta-lactamase class C family)